MSLINQMLRDLEQRNKAPENIKATQTPAIPLLRQPARGKRSPFWPALGLVTAVGLLGWLWLSHHGTPQPQPVPEPETPTQTSQQPIKPPAPNPPATAENSVTGDANIQSESELSAPPAPIALAQTTAAEPMPEAAPSAPTIKIEAKQNATVSTKKAPKLQSRRLDRAESLYRQADNSASRAMRKESLREVLDIDPKHLPARQKLLALLVQERSTLELKQFLDESLALYPNHLSFVTTLAHYYMQQKDVPAAIATLERIDSFSASEPHYLQLLAAAYQQRQAYAKALPIYQKLSQLQPDKAEHWLGLGVCADNLRQPRSAVHAYQRALDKNTLSGDVVDYIKQRLSTLNH